MGFPEIHPFLGSPTVSEIIGPDRLTDPIYFGRIYHWMCGPGVVQVVNGSKSYHLVNILYMLCGSTLLLIVFQKITLPFV